MQTHCPSDAQLNTWVVRQPVEERLPVVIPQDDLGLGPRRIGALEGGGKPSEGH